jgi:YD repeat-containing protein
MITQTYDLKGNVIAVTDAEGFTTNYTYDAWGQLRSVFKPKRANNSVDNAALPATTDGLRDFYEYDLAGNLTKKVERGLATEYAYNTAGQVIGEAKPHKTDKGSIDKAYGYRLDGRLLAESTYGTSATYFQDPNRFGNGSSYKPTRGHLTTYKLDYRGFKIAEWADSASISAGRIEIDKFSSYNGLGQIFYQSATFNSDIYAYCFDGLVSRNFYRTYWKYDQNGNLLEKWDTCSATKNNPYTYTYSPTNKPITEQRSVEAKSIASQLVQSRLFQAGKTQGTVSTTYDARDQIQTVTLDDTDLQNRLLNQTTSYSYFQSGLLWTKSVTRSDNVGSNANNIGNQGFEYDKRGRLILDVDSNAGKTSTFTYASDGTVTEAISDGYSKTTTPTVGNLTATTTTNIPWAYPKCDQNNGPSGGQCIDTDTVSYDTNGAVINSSSRHLYAPGGLADAPSKIDVTTVQATNNTDDYFQGLAVTRTTTGYGFGSYISEGKSSSYTYDTNGAVSSQNLEGVATTYTLDAKGRRLSAASPSNIYNYKKRYDADGRATSYYGTRIANPGGVCGGPQEYLQERFDFLYDPQGNLALETKLWSDEYLDTNPNSPGGAYLISCRLYKCVQHDKPDARKCTATQVLK